MITARHFRSISHETGRYRFCFVLWVLIFSLLSTAAAATEPENSSDSRAPIVRFENPLSRVEAASHQMGGVNTIVQDTYGFMWMGAENGLGRYDGLSLRVYQAEAQIPRSLPASYITKLALDRNGVLWQGSEGGLSRYHPETDDFTHFETVGRTRFTSEAITGLAVGKDNTLYAGGAGAIHVISPDRSSMTVHRFNPPVESGPNIEQVRDLAVDAQGQVWVATAGMGVAVFNPKTERFRYLVNDRNNPNSLAYNSVRVITHDDQGRVWLGTYGGGISLLDPETGVFTHFRHHPDDPRSLRVNIVWDITQDSEGIIWITLDQGGLARFDEATQSFDHYLHSPYDPQSLVSNQVRVVFEDSANDLWIGAFPSGVSFYNRSTQVFKHHTTRSNDPTSISHNAILRFLEARDGTIWVGTEGGLNALDPDTGLFTRYLSKPSDPYSLKANPVLALEEDIDGQIWVGTWAGGLHRLDPATGQFTHYAADRSDPTRLNDTFVWNITRSRDNTLWIGTENGGLNRYHPDTDSFSHFVHTSGSGNSVSGNFIPAVIEDRHGKLWVGSFSGLDILDLETEQFTHIPAGTGAPNAISSPNIRSLYEDSTGKVWVGTQHRGVNIFDPDTRTFSHLDVPDGLPSSNISSIVEDDTGTIWLATASGLARLDVETGQITNFGREHGLAGSHYNRDATLKDRAGNLYFGSSEGITVFHPDDLVRESAEFPVVITNLRILNREMYIGTEGSPLTQSILTTQALTLGHQDTMFSFDFAALNFRQSGTMRYSYMLEGFDRSWNNIGQIATATYTNINPGEYRFRVRASTNGRDWVEGQTLAITILAPPWRTWWAYSLYALLFAALLLFAQKYITLQVRAELYRSKAITDPLTGLYNRAGVAQISEGIFANLETKKGTCLMLMDIDHFKRINDRRGHDAGDRILCELADAAKSHLRSSDYLGRWGGEEFVILCATNRPEDSHLLAEKVRKAIEERSYEQQQPIPLRVTVSIGVTNIRPDDSFESALKRADKALYQAKEKGRNCVVVTD
ncbi:ligand-binding sensor domain-containing diguanylate cyclase [Marinimicrobium sp. ABcell2]|uniref:ligand-binding sensor domain-containing diguanylate cyclase n=1 Tax=Marinimicrobium sp. ABcell2 TaxID=3069751 RepID=UPI0027B0E5BF|nr:ligand-binding sensor domain-containing diguanylate cyclase [Marinimicrobium sp. ABcell2]MDQ2076113.1 two-component regulator propeller domain-containing protein [Marinimicrobium sp. ABcell2]